MKTPKNGNEIRALELFEQALKYPVEERQAFIINETGENKALRQHVEKLLHLDAQNSSEMLTGHAVFDTPEEDLKNVEIGSYRIIELIGKGGMGAVYKAERKTGDFTHSVAIKVIRPGVLSEALIERFERERQTLADFSHPHIARLLDGGTTEDGAPYIIMEYIDGAAITDFADHKQLNKINRLKLFQNACAAISYAHQNLIVHRDITPNNVLVTQDGDVKLIDFGISKTVDQSIIAEPTDNSLASLSFTPGFAAPERSKGAAANTLSDIYSLGKLLEALLQDSIRSDDVKAIIAKATHLNPQKRYTSVDTLIEDINNYNQGFPVSAIAATSRYKLSKFIRRHSLGVAASTLAILGLITAFGVTTYQYQRAESARQNADQRFDEVRELATFMLFDLYDDLQKVPGNTKALTDIADTSRQYLDRLHEQTTSTGLKLETAIGYKRLSDVMGNPIGPNLGRRTDTAELLEVAYHELETLHKAEPKNPEITRALAEAAYSYAVYEFIAEDDNKDARRYARRAEALYQGLIDSNVATHSDKLKRISAALQAAKTYYWDGEGEKGIIAMKAIVKDMDAFLIEHPDNSEARFLSASVYSETGLTIGSHYSVTGEDTREAIPYMNRAHETYTKLLADYPDDVKVRRNLVAIHYKRALILSPIPRLEDALSDANEGLKIAQSFLDKDPDDTGMLRTKLALRQLKGSILSKLENFDEAAIIIRDTSEILSGLAIREPDSPGRAREYGNVLVALADVEALAGNLQSSCNAFTDAKGVWENIEQRWGMTEFDKEDGYARTLKGIESCNN